MEKPTFQPLGVGLLYNPALPPFLKDCPQYVDYIEVIPDMFWTDAGRHTPHRFTMVPSWQKQLNSMAKKWPLVAHNIGFSLGTANYFDHEYLHHLKKLDKKYKFKWHSEHLSFIKLPTAGTHDHNAGMAIPVPYDEEMLQLLHQKINLIQKEISSPFLIENNVYFVTYPDQDYTETEFTNRLINQPQVGLLLDLHNLHCNAVNLGLNPYSFIQEIDTHKIIEIHIAGGNAMGDFYADSHAGPCPDEVWQLLEYTLPKCPNIQGITFEFHDSYFHVLQYEGLIRELTVAKNLWNQYHPMYRSSSLKTA